MPALLLRGGRIRTLDRARPLGAALLVRDRRVAAVLDAGERPAAARVVSLPAGACVVPGFTDAHVHLLSWAAARSELRLDAAGSLDAVLARVGAAVAGVPRGGWLRGFGWTAVGWAPDRAALDAVSGAVPVALLAHDWHTLWVNSAALAVAGGELEVPGGVVERDAAGAPTGVLREAAAWAFRDRFAPPPAEYARALRAALPELAARGVVAVHDKDGALGCVDVVSGLRRDGPLPLRVWHSVPVEAAEDPRAGYVKAFLDGTLGSGTARMLGGGGVEVTSGADFEAIVARAAALGRAVAVHAIGDRAVRDALDAFAATAPLWRPRGLRQRVEHAQCVHPDDLARFAQLGVTASVQPAMAMTDEPVARRAWGDRLERAYPYASLHAAGARLAGGSDAPVEGLDPLAGMRAAVLEHWRPEERLGAEDALRAWTTVPAWLEGAEGRRGRLAPGLAADLVVLDRDPLEDLAGARVVATMVGGEWAHGGDTVDR